MNDKKVEKLFKLKYQNIFQFEITLMGLQPSIWRQIQVPDNYSFWDLHVAIQDVMGWTDAHLHEFIVINRKTRERSHLGTPDQDGIDDPPLLSDIEYKIADYIFLENSKFIYIYDFGDNWEHEMVLEKILPVAENINYPVCIGGERSCPPEDVGGIPGYENFLQIISDPDHEEYEDMIQWAGETFDPAKFNPKEVKFCDPKEAYKDRIY